MKIPCILFAIIVSLGLYAQSPYNEITNYRKQTILIENFANNSRNWQTNTKWLCGEVTNNSYHITCENYRSNIGLSYIPLNINEFRDFEIEALIENTEGNGGIVWGLDEDLNHYRLEILENKSLLVVHFNAKKQLYKKLLKVDAENIINSASQIKVTIIKSGHEYLFYCNDVFLGRERSIKFHGNNIGFCVGLNSYLSINELRVSYLEEPQENEPPVLIVQNITFNDENRNEGIDSQERAHLLLSLKNKGKGIAENVTIYPSVSRTTIDIVIPDKITLGNILPGADTTIEIPIEAGKILADGTMVIEILFEELNGFAPHSITKDVAVFSKKLPVLKIVDYCFSSEQDKIALGEFIWLNIQIKNTGEGIADSVKILFDVPKSTLFNLNGESIYIDKIEPDESKEFKYKFITTNTYDKPTIPITINIQMHSGEYSCNKTAVAYISEKTGLCLLGSDLHKNIPENPKKSNNSYALIIGNEDYSSYQSGLNTEQNADFSVNDAIVFSEYVKKTLGVPEEHVHLLTNATAGQMRQELAWLRKVAENTESNADIIFYYSGHGLPNQNTKKPYLIPVDISGLDLSLAINLDTVLATLASCPCRRINIFLDACFSGGARNEPLLSSRGVLVKPKNIELSENMIYFASSSEIEASGAYYEKKHGYFTYYLLKSLKDSKGNLSYGEWFDKTKQEVIRQTSIYDRLQTPQVRVNMQTNESWREWKVK